MLKKNFSLLTEDITDSKILKTINTTLNNLTGKNKQIALTTLRQKRFININVDTEITISISDTGYLPVLRLSQFFKLRENDLLLTKKQLEKSLKNVNSELKKITGKTK